MTHRHAEQVKTQQLLTKLANYTNMTKAMRECLEAIANGDADAQAMAQQTLAKLNKDYGNESGRT